MNAQPRIDNPDLYALAAWLSEHADELDANGPAQAELLSRLAQSGLFRVSVPEELGGDGQPVSQAIDAIAEVARYSLTAAFVAWGHRTFIEYLLASPNFELAQQWLPALLEGEIAGATALSNAMKYLSGIEDIQIRATPHDDGWRLNGKLFWVTNLDPKGYLVAAIVENGPDHPPSIALLDSRQEGLTRSDNLDLLALRGSSTAALQIDNLTLEPSQIIHPDALRFCPSIRPRFLGLQCGMSIGHVRASLDSISLRARQHNGSYLQPALSALQETLEQHTTALYEGVNNGLFATAPAELFKLRIALAELVQRATNQELEATGGNAYLLDKPTGFGRRWHEAAFIPVVTPSVSQLKGELAKHEDHSA
jgi:alkylation response protein AidB-like acyl-CoA dehydrogenase